MKCPNLKCFCSCRAKYCDSWVYRCKHCHWRLRYLCLLFLWTILPPPQKPWYWNGSIGFRGQSQRGWATVTPKGQLAERSKRKVEWGNYLTAHLLSTKKSHMGWHFKNRWWSFWPLVESLYSRTLRWAWHHVAASLRQACGTVAKSHALSKSNFPSLIAKYS